MCITIFICIIILSFIVIIVRYYLFDYYYTDVGSATQSFSLYLYSLLVYPVGLYDNKLELNLKRLLASLMPSLPFFYVFFLNV